MAQVLSWLKHLAALPYIPRLYVRIALDGANALLPQDLSRGRKVHPQISECIEKNQERIVDLVLEQAVPGMDGVRPHEL